jgi:hypothetical protein
VGVIEWKDGRTLHNHKGSLKFYILEVEGFQVMMRPRVWLYRLLKYKIQQTKVTG